MWIRKYPRNSEYCFIPIIGSCIISEVLLMYYIVLYIFYQISALKINALANIYLRNPDRNENIFFATHKFIIKQITNHGWYIPEL